MTAEVSTPVVLGWGRPGSSRMSLPGAAWHARRLLPWVGRVSWAHLLVTVRPVLSYHDFELVALRAAWNAGAYEEWAAHNIFDRFVFGPNHLERVYSGSDTPGLAARSAAVLRAVDELHDDLAMSEQTWDGLQTWFDDRQRMMIVKVSAMYELLGVVLTSLGLPAHVVPEIGARTAAAHACGPRRRRAPGPSALRHRPAGLDFTGVVPGFDPGVWTPMQLGTALSAETADPRMLRVVLSAMAGRTHPSLPERDATLAALRLIHRGGPVAEWAPRLALATKLGIGEETLKRIVSEENPADDRDGTMLRAVDELDSDYFLSDATWQRMTTIFTRQQLIEFLFFIGHRRLLSMVLNTEANLTPGRPSRAGK